MLPDDRDRLIHEKLLLSAITMNSLDVHIVAAFQTAKPALSQKPRTAMVVVVVVHMAK